MIVQKEQEQDLLLFFSVSTLFLLSSSFSCRWTFPTSRNKESI